MHFVRHSVILVLAVLAGCSNNRPGSGQVCNAAHPCPDGLICRGQPDTLEGTCAAGCKDASGCSPGELCVAGACALVCVSDRDCPVAQSCSAGVCQTVNHQCTADRDCTHPGLCAGADGASCHGGLCSYLPAVAGTPCDDGTGCIVHATCNASGKCVGTPIVCDQVPEPICAGTGVAEIYDGACIQGACVYTPTSVSCTSCPDSLACLSGCMIDTNGDGVPERIAGGTFAVGDGCLVCAQAQSLSKWSAVACAQVIPINVCRTLAGQCVSTELGGACSGQSCCVFGPSWPPGDTAAQPQCPLGVEDVGGDGVALGEVWSGVCTHDGNCAGCTLDSQCDDANECSADFCVGGVCTHDLVTKIGTACTTTGSLVADDGKCVSVGNAVVCRPKLGAACNALAGGSDCASGHCVDGVCCESACDGICAQCGSDGKCSVAPADDAACGTLACSGLNSTCRTYNAITNGRCASFGACKSPNTLATCTSYADAPNGSECGSRYCSALVWMRQTCTGGSCASNATQQNCADGVACTTDSCDGAAGCTNTQMAAGSTCGQCTTCDAARNCNQFVAHGADDAWNSCATQSCNGAGGCGRPEGQACAQNYECESSLCVNSLCVAKYLKIDGSAWPNPVVFEAYSLLGILYARTSCTPGDSGWVMGTAASVSSGSVICGAGTCYPVYVMLGPTSYGWSEKCGGTTSSGSGSW